MWLPFRSFLVNLQRVPPSQSITSGKEGNFWYSLQSMHDLMSFQQVTPLSSLFQRCQITLLQPLFICMANFSMKLSSSSHDAGPAQVRLYLSSNMGPMLVCSIPGVFLLLPCRLLLLCQSPCCFIFFFRISSSHIFNSVCWSHALVNGPTSKRPASDGGICSGQLLMMWSAVCSGSPHSHAALSASPHFFMDDLYRPTPVLSLFRVVPCFRISSCPLTPSPGSDTWRCTRVGPEASHSCFQVAAIHASFDRSSGMTLCIS